MKKLVLFPILLVCMAFTSCGGPKPSDTVKECINAMNDQEWEKMMSCFDLKEDQQKTMAGLFTMKGQELQKEEGKVTDVEIVDENIFADGDSAIVKYYTTTEKKGKGSEKTQKMVKKDGQWKMVMEGK